MREDPTRPFGDSIVTGGKNPSVPWMFGANDGPCAGAGGGGGAVQGEGGGGRVSLGLKTRRCPAKQSLDPFLASGNTNRAASHGAHRRSPLPLGDPTENPSGEMTVNA